MAHWIAQTSELLRFYPWRHLWLRWVRYCILYIGFLAVITLPFNSGAWVYGFLPVTLIQVSGHLHRYLPADIPKHMRETGFVGFILGWLFSVICFAGSTIGYFLSWNPLGALPFSGSNLIILMLPMSTAIGAGAGQGLAIRQDIPTAPAWEWVATSLVGMGLALALYPVGQAVFGANGWVSVLAALGAGGILGAIPGLAMVRLVGLYLPEALQGGYPVEWPTLATAAR